eukprot:CAMPEP_0116019552 /NCGR_PEP_ID=MMETSP0321-20121206/9300_1 /TAXON_ID=163516 /ORGANISM="Leptocylindrus danicus var. danicus, Strain B650" /LENGTH=161 /DNA_ID=CAMNT_0003490135 /DNA_START=115 /DNA_END=597 /DNA_ORIENTATION=+
MCPYAQKAWIALEASGCTYDLQEISLYGANGKPSWFLKLNPTGTVPVITHKDDVIPDSELILDYIANGKVEGGTAQLENGAYSMKWRNVIKQQLAPIGKRAVLGGEQSKLMKLLQEMDADVQGPYLCGENVSTADCAAFPFLWRVNTEFGLPQECENLSAW